jgi:hypothetical protein
MICRIDAIAENRPLIKVGVHSSGCRQLNTEFIPVGHNIGIAAAFRLDAFRDRWGAQHRKPAAMIASSGGQVYVIGRPGVKTEILAKSV